MSSPAWNRRRRNVSMRLLARRLRIPARFLLAGPTSSEAFRAYEQPVVDRVQARQAMFATALREALR